MLHESALDVPTYLGAANDAGLVRVHADRVELLDGGYIGAGSFGGNAGNVEVRTDSLLISATDRFGNTGGLFAAAFGPTGDAGAIDIETGSLVIAPGGIINAEAGPGSSGIAGTVTVRAESVRIGPDPDAPPARRLVREPAFITVTSFGTGNGGTIEVAASRSILLTFEGGLRLSEAEQAVRLQFGVPALRVGIFSATVSGGGGGSIQLRAPDISVTHGAIVATSTLGGGTAGAIRLEGERLRVENGGAVDSSSLPHPLTFAPSLDAGTVTLVATESIEVLGSDPMFGVSRVSSFSAGSGAAGALRLAAPRIVVDGGAVATTALRSGDGQEGTQGGAITLEAEQLLVTNGGQVDASTFIAGEGGSIEVTAGESIMVEGEGSGIASRTGGPGAGGSVTLRAPRIEIADGAEVAAKSEQGFGGMARIFAGAIEEGLIAGSPGSGEVTGDAGSVTLAAEHVRIDGGSITTRAELADGGDVTIEAKDLVHLDAGVVTAAVRDGAGGNISIDPEVVILQNGSRIVADAGTGSGGNIQITADNYFAFPGSVVDASSELGIDGTVEISAPDVDLAGKITALPTTPLDAASLMRERCAARRSGERAGSFAVRGNGGIPAEPDGWLPGTVVVDASLTTAPVPLGSAAKWPGGVSPQLTRVSCR